MFSLNFLKAGIAIPVIKVGNINDNANEIIKILDQSKAAVVLFPELNLTSLYCGDLFSQSHFLDEALDAAIRIIASTTYRGLFTIGLPFELENNVYNAVLVVSNQEIIGISVKNNLTNAEKRYFTEYLEDPIIIDRDGEEIPFGVSIFTYNDLKIGLEIGQDGHGVFPKSDILAANGANVLLNPASDYEYLNSGSDKIQRALEHSKRQISAYLYASPSPTESTSQYVYAGDMIAAINGEIIDEASALYDGFNYLEFDVDLNYLNHQRKLNNQLPSFDSEIEILFDLDETDDYSFEFIDNLPFFDGGNMTDNCSVINQLLIQALIKKLSSLPKHLQKVVIGVSGGADSTLALLIAEQAVEKMGLDRTALIGVSMPSNNSSQESSKRALELIEKTKATKFLIPIDEQLNLHLKSIDHDLKDVTYENAQARIRTNILMDLANKHGGIVLGTGDLSEIALGFATYNGDASSMYGINSGIPKTVVLEMLRYLSSEVYLELSEVIYEIANTKPSPELLKGQITEDIIGRYDINDFILYHFVKSGWQENELLLTIPQAFDVSKAEALTYIKRFFKRFYQSQFKRQVMPEGPNILNFSLNPYDGFRLAGDNEVE